MKTYTVTLPLGLEIEVKAARYMVDEVSLTFYDDGQNLCASFREWSSVVEAKPEA